MNLSYAPRPCFFASSPEDMREGWMHRRAIPDSGSRVSRLIDPHPLPSLFH
jgi:hypothetical protein